MSIKLLLMRHANTENSLTKMDIERLLTKSGELEAVDAAKFLANFPIDKAIVSYAGRTKQTFAIIQEQLKIKQIDIVTYLYQNSPEDIINSILLEGNESKNILIIGHNPSIYNLALTLSESNSEEYVELLDTGMPTAKIVVIEFDGIKSWKNINTIKGKIIDSFIPTAWIK